MNLFGMKQTVASWVAKLGTLLLVGTTVVFLPAPANADPLTYTREVTEAEDLIDQNLSSDGYGQMFNTDEVCDLEPDLSSSVRYSINNVGDLHEMRDCVFSSQYADGASPSARATHTFALTDDIDLAHIPWVPFDMAWAELNGNDHVIRNFSAISNSDGRSGLFGEVFGSVITNLRFESVGSVEGCVDTDMELGDEIFAFSGRAGVLAASIGNSFVNDIEISGTPPREALEDPLSTESAHVEACFNEYEIGTRNTQGDSYAGGLAGAISNSAVSAISVEGLRIFSEGSAGAIAGAIGVGGETWGENSSEWFLDGVNQLSPASLFTVSRSHVVGGHNAGGLFGSNGVCLSDEIEDEYLDQPGWCVAGGRVENSRVFGTQVLGRRAGGIIGHNYGTLADSIFRPIFDFEGGEPASASVRGLNSAGGGFEAAGGLVGTQGHDIPFGRSGELASFRIAAAEENGPLRLWLNTPTPHILMPGDRVELQGLPEPLSEFNGFHTLESNGQFDCDQSIPLHSNLCEEWSEFSLPLTTDQALLLLAPETNFERDLQIDFSQSDDLPTFSAEIGVFNSSVRLAEVSTGLYEGSYFSVGGAVGELKGSSILRDIQVIKTQLKCTSLGCDSFGGIVGETDIDFYQAFWPYPNPPSTSATHENLVFTGSMRFQPTGEDGDFDVGDIGGIAGYSSLSAFTNVLAYFDVVADFTEAAEEDTGELYDLGGLIGNPRCSSVVNGQSDYTLDLQTQEMVPVVAGVGGLFGDTYTRGYSDSQERGRCAQLSDIGYRNLISQALGSAVQFSGSHDQLGQISGITYSRDGDDSDVDFDAQRALPIRFNDIVARGSFSDSSGPTVSAMFGRAGVCAFEANQIVGGAGQLFSNDLNRAANEYDPSLGEPSICHPDRPSLDVNVANIETTNSPGQAERFFAADPVNWRQSNISGSAEALLNIESKITYRAPVMDGLRVGDNVRITANLDLATQLSGIVDLPWFDIMGDELPAGLVFDYDTGRISGTAAAPGSATFKVVAHLGNAMALSPSYRLTVLPALVVDSSGSGSGSAPTPVPTPTPTPGLELPAAPVVIDAVKPATKLPDRSLKFSAFTAAVKAKFVAEFKKLKLKKPALVECYVSSSSVAKSRPVSNAICAVARQVLGKNVQLKQVPRGSKSSGAGFEATIRPSVRHGVRNSV